MHEVTTFPINSHYKTLCLHLWTETEPQKKIFAHDESMRTTLVSCQVLSEKEWEIDTPGHLADEIKVLVSNRKT
jgi:hypothetical protein